MDDLVAHIDRRAMDRERLLDRIDGPDDPGAEAARCAEQDIERRLRHDGCDVARRRPGVKRGRRLFAAGTRRGPPHLILIMRRHPWARGARPEDPRERQRSVRMSHRRRRPAGDETATVVSHWDDVVPYGVILGPKGAPLTLASNPLY